MDGLLPPGWQDIGAQGLVVLFVLMIFLGWLLPKRWVDKMLREKDDRIAEQGVTIRVQRKTIEELTAANQDFAVGNYTAAHALRSVAKSKPSPGGDGS